MKTYLYILAATFASLSACTTSNGVTSSDYKDDIYYSSKDAAADKEKRKAEQEKALADKQKSDAAKTAAENYTSTQNNNTTNDNNRTKQNSSGKTDDYYQKTENQRTATTITNNYYDEPFNYDDYYDDEYAVRLKHFHNHCGSYGYFDNYYTNSYLYTGNPYNYGISVYSGYNFWGSSYITFAYNPGFYWYSNMGWGYDSWYNPYSYNPYYGYNGYYGYNPYMNGYVNGYNQGYYNGYNNAYYNNNYFNSYDNNSYYYGPRKTTGANGRTSAQPSIANRYMDAKNEEVKNTANPKNDDRNSSKPVYLNATPGTSERPASNTFQNNSAMPDNPVNTNKPEVEKLNTKPVYTETKPVYNEPKPINREKPVYSEPKPAYNETKPINQGNPDRVNPYKEKPENNNNNYQEKPKPVNEQMKPHHEQQKNMNEQPKNNINRQESGNPAPRNNSTNSTSEPKKRGR